MSKINKTTVRDLSYRSCVPYYILFDEELNIQHIKLYTIIEQMESNPNPKINPTFSYSWFAKLIGVEIRAAKRIAEKMKTKGYLVHKQLPSGKWIWGTSKKEILHEDEPIDESGIDDIDEIHPVSLEDTPSVAGEHPPVAWEATQKTIKTKVHKETTKLENSSSFIFSEKMDEQLLNQKLPSDNRTNDEFLKTCSVHVDHCSDPSLPRMQRVYALIKLLTRLKLENIIFMTKNITKPTASNNITIKHQSSNVEYLAYLSQFRNDKEVMKLIPADSMPMNYEEWELSQQSRIAHA